MAATVIACVGLGSNLADPVAQVRRAFAALQRLPDTRLRSRSALYRSAPMGPADQPDYVNAAAVLETRLEPLPLLDALQAIEQAQGRVRDGVRWGPRTLDLDLLLYGERIIEEVRLTVPHPGLAERDFVLIPLREAAGPDLPIPGHGRLGDLPVRAFHGLERIDG